MENLRFNELQFELRCTNFDKNTLRIVSFEGSEQISGLYEYRFRLFSESPSLDTKEILNYPASFIMNRGEKDPRNINGIISNFKQLGRTPDYVSYQAVLVPRLWRLLLTKQSKIFQNLTIEDLITKVLMEAGFKKSDFEFNLENSYPTQEFLVQFQETDLNFINRRLEHLGIFYFFDQRGKDDVVVFCDSNEPLLQIETTEGIDFNPNKDLLSVQETISELVLDESVVTGKFQVRTIIMNSPPRNCYVIANWIRMLQELNIIMEIISKQKVRVNFLLGSGMKRSCAKVIYSRVKVIVVYFGQGIGSNSGITTGRIGTKNIC
ncbi:MAG: type VI secretion system tip protein VgrG [bacterium]|nr:MAG: type VI secretion system tip protein VgrG [bacterium]